MTEAVVYDDTAITIPRKAPNVQAMQAEFFSTVPNLAIYGGN